MKTEVTRHIFDGGKLNLSGTLTASQNVLSERGSSQSFRMLLGLEEPTVSTGILLCSHTPAILFSFPYPYYDK